MVVVVYVFVCVREREREREQMCQPSKTKENLHNGRDFVYFPPHSFSATGEKGREKIRHAVVHVVHEVVLQSYFFHKIIPKLVQILEKSITFS